MTRFQFFKKIDAGSGIRVIFEETNMKVTIGCELEGWATSSTGELLDTLAVLNGGIKTSKPFEGVTSDMALSSIEYITSVCESGQELLRSLEGLHKRVPADVVPAFHHRLWVEDVLLARKSRVHAVSDALAREHPQGHLGVASVAPNAATQYHLGVPNVLNEQGVVLLNLLTNIAPHISHQVCKRYGVQDYSLNFWHGWCKKERVAAPRWFSSANELNSFVRSIPKLVTKKDDEWIVADTTARSSIEDAESVGTLWWPARPRIFTDSENTVAGHTIELRPFPSLAPKDAADLGDDLANLVREFWNYMQANPNARWDTPARAERLYRHLLRFDLVPSKPLTDDEWWRLYRS